MIVTTGPGGPPTIAYRARGRLYLNITSRCTLSCRFCPKHRHQWTVGGVNLFLSREPSVEEVLIAAGDVGGFDEVVFCGLGEPTLRLYDMLEMAGRLKERGARRVRVDTDGLANLVYRRDVTPDFEGLIDALSISLNAQDEATYEYYCRPSLAGSYGALLDFADRARDFVPEVRFTAIAGLTDVDIAACDAIARRLGVTFYRRALDDI